MKVKNKKYLLGFSLLCCLILGIFLAKFIFSGFYFAGTAMDSIDYLFIGRDIRLYTEQADAIIVGEIREVNDPYYRKDRGITSQQDIKIDVKEVLKGDTNIAAGVTVLIEGGHIDGKTVEGGISFASGEKVLLFLGTTTWGDYVPFAGPYGKYLIDKDNKVSSIGEFEMPLEDLKAKIQDALKMSGEKTSPISLSQN